MHTLHNKPVGVETPSVVVAGSMALLVDPMRSSCRCSSWVGSMTHHQAQPWRRRSSLLERALAGTELMIELGPETMEA